MSSNPFDPNYQSQAVPLFDAERARVQRDQRGGATRRRQLQPQLEATHRDHCDRLAGKQVKGMHVPRPPKR